jgi:hypothetical protein
MDIVEVLRNGYSVAAETGQMRDWLNARRSVPVLFQFDGAVLRLGFESEGEATAFADWTAAAPGVNQSAAGRSRFPNAARIVLPDIARREMGIAALGHSLPRIGTRLSVLAQCRRRVPRQMEQAAAQARRVQGHR